METDDEVNKRLKLQNELEAEYKDICGREVHLNGFTTFLIKKLIQAKKDEQQAFEAGRKPFKKKPYSNRTWEYSTFKDYEKREKP